MQTEQLAREIKVSFEGDVEFDSETLQTYSRDASLFSVTPQLVVFPRHSQDLRCLIEFVHNARKRGVALSLTARSAGTDMSGGPLTTSIVVSFGRYMNHLRHLSESYAVVEPGMYYRDFEKETLKHGTLLPSYPASRELAMMGGIVNNNSGGEKTLKYGKTDRYVSALTMMLSDGNEYEFRKLSIPDAEKKALASTLEGSIYMQMLSLVRDNYELLQSHKPQVSKNSSGYALWDVYNKEANTFDLTKVFVGAQGTLGIMTSAEIQLVPVQKSKRMLVMFLNSTDFLGDLVQDVLRFSPESFESYDDHTIHLAIKFFPGLVSRLKGNLLRAALSFIPEIGMILRGGIPKLVLLAEFTAENIAAAHAQAERCRDAVAKKYPIRTRVTKSDVETDEYWIVRRESFNLLRKKVRGLHTAPFIDDVVVHPSHLPEFLPQLNELFEPYKILYTVAGHVGDGNFHIIPLMDLRNPESKKIIEELGPKVYSLVLSYGGSITGEHNDGMIRTPYVKNQFGPEVYALFLQTKKIFDPLNIFNPGKKVSGTIEYALSHLDLAKVA